jgi:hypothetical protein
MIVDGIVEPMELGHLPYKKGTYEDYVGYASLERHGQKKWRRHVADVVYTFHRRARTGRNGDRRRQRRGSLRRFRRTLARATTPTPSAAGFDCGMTRDQALQRARTDTPLAVVARADVLVAGSAIFHDGESVTAAMEQSRAAIQP